MERPVILPILIMVELTERFLSDVGGWQALKHARSLNASGRVSEATYEFPLLRGRVREGETEYQAGLEIRSKSDVANLCRCRESRQWGKICAHSLAVGMAILKPVQTESRSTSAPETATPTDGYRFAIADGPDIELQLALPPNLEAAWERDRVAVGVEFMQGNRRTLLDALPAGSYGISAHDLTLIDRLRSINGGAVAGMLSLPKTDFLQLMEAAIGHPRVTLNRRQPVRLTAETPSLLCEETPEGGLRLSVKLPSFQKLLTTPSAIWGWGEGRLVHLSSGVPAAYLGVYTAPVVLDPSAASHFVKTELEALSRVFRLEGLAPERAAVSQKSLPVALETPEFFLKLEGSLNHLAAQLFAEYAGKRFQLGVDQSSSGTPRNQGMEQVALKRLHDSGFSGPDRQGQLTLRTERQILQFFASRLPLLERDWQVEIGNRFRHVTAQVERVTPEIQIARSGEDWFEMGIEFGTSGGEKISTMEIQRLLRSGQSHFRGKNGRLAVLDTEMLDDFEQVLADCAPTQKVPGQYRIARNQAGYLASTLAQTPGFRLQGEPLDRPVPLPELSGVGDLSTILRHYQWDGVCGLHERALKLGGAILADEMGLGKTIQALALIRLQRRLLDQKKPSLVVGPSSLVFNWQREAEKFTPELRIVTVQGADREADWPQVGAADLVLTSYPILQRDLPKFEQVSFGSVFLDEAQHIKNPETQNAKAAVALQADFRFVLTGTPVENSIRDIWSLVHFIAPGYLGDRPTFRERFELPIQRDPKAPELSRFRRRISPFLIRRTKKEVLTELPEKTLQVSYHEMIGKQSELYSELVRQGRELVSTLASAQGGKSARMAALSLLLRLRQVCCDPDLVLEQPGQTREPAARSGKFEAFRELLLEAIDGGHRVLVFSQFVKVLAGLRQILESEEIEHCYLDGSTRKRASEVDRFQAPEGPPVFLISLKAGGTGLNLTAADTVIHIDPWWNPAVEDQATDRIHRIGQQRPVTAYKLITRGTVEEKILALQERKRAVIDAVIESEEPMMTGLTDQDLRELLS